ncbi:hypothetical protein WA026_018753 [Henosepilachna vigintioctopunctata]|uniref:Uncharacterized protein n=1 Tax=Henosepilachna vigintioctopunctata TaxID=420089 RepID=A0AAW1TMC8_9CUCU
MSLQSITEYLDDMKVARRRAKDYESVDYTKLQHVDNGSFVDEQFVLPAQNIPWKAIILASLLLVVGSLLLIFGILGEIKSVKYCVSPWLLNLIVSGILVR